MLLPPSVLRALRGPALAVAVVGCASPEVAIAPTPVDEGASLVVTPSALPYDEHDEAERLERLDRTLAASDGRRSRRIDRKERARRASWLASQPIRLVHPACGRG